MKIEEEISQPKFRNATQKALINVIFTSHWILDKQQSFFKPFGITSQQFNILRILRGQYPQGISGATLKARMMDKNSDVSRLLDRLEVKELIEKRLCPSDKRATDIFITQKGLDVLAELDKNQTEFDAILALTDSEAMLLSELLDKARG
ncbi:MarR family winged helix-turn-helix transcriptional regulator [Ohtaekwangia koreensis]|jgi:DNA-binding MarR family transcriptional regulator|uniref:DNA-binding transcriptional regulator, MarR family n=1 Tax=Ohtaekwangia koreensis TaxID=688867 RepID=A0A1T5MCS4_9BACT|nr:MarR family transcriptional regulator [Ohtaekwangia koreensis]SKC85883.1 DNA-binding transcriptional regulator, MarR family [Ohtaekwangia koreensis]